MIIFLYGEDNFRSRQKLNELKEKYIKEVDKRASGLKTISGLKASFSEIIEAIGPSSLLSKKRLIIIEDIFSNKDQAIFEKLKDYLKNKKQEDNIIILLESNIKSKKIRNSLVPMLLDSAGKDKPLNKKQADLFKFLSGQKYSFSYNLLSNTELAGWAKKLAGARGGKISLKAAETLIGLVGNNGWQISNELDKLLSYKATVKLTDTDAEIGVEDVKKLVQGNFSENIFALTDALSNKNKILAIKLLDEQIEAGSDGQYLLNMFIRQFRILLQIKQAVDSGFSQRQIIGQLKLHPFVLQKGMEQVRGFSLQILKNILSQLVRIDYLVKSGQSEYIVELNRLIAKI
jgi:DNA polymerase III delta subunit